MEDDTYHCPRNSSSTCETCSVDSISLHTEKHTFWNKNATERNTEKSEKKHRQNTPEWTGSEHTRTYQSVPNIGEITQGHTEHIPYSRLDHYTTENRTAYRLNPNRTKGDQNRT